MLRRYYFSVKIDYLAELERNRHAVTKTALVQVDFDLEFVRMEVVIHGYTVVLVASAVPSADADQVQKESR